MVICDLAHHAYAVAHTGAAPHGVHHQPVQPVFLIHRDQHRECSIRFFRRCGCNGIQQLAAVLAGEKCQAHTLIKVQLLGSVDRVLVAVNHSHAVAEYIVIELNTAALLGIKSGALPFQIQQALGTILTGQSFAVQDLLRKAAGLVAETAVILRALQLCAQQLRGFFQAFHQQRIEAAALAVQDHVNGLFVAVGLLITALAGQCVVHIGQCHHLCCNGDLVALEPVRVAAAVPPLVVPAADSVCHLYQRFVLPDGKPLQDPGTLGGVGLDGGVLFLGQAAGLVQDLFRDHDFADIVQRRRCADQRDITLIQLVTVSLLHQLMQEQVGQGADVQHMLAALAVAELHHMAQNADHQHTVVLFFVHLIGHKAGKALLLCVKHERILHPAQHHDPLERAADVIGHAHIIGALDASGVLCRADHNDRDFLLPCIALHHPQHIKAVHFRHDQVQQHQRDIGASAQNFDRAQAVLGFQIFVALTQNLLEHSAVDLRVIHDQYFLFWFHLNRSSLLYFRPQGLPFPTGPQKKLLQQLCALQQLFISLISAFFAGHPAFRHAPIISSNQFISSTERCSNLVWGFQSG